MAHATRVYAENLTMKPGTTVKQAFTATAAATAAITGTLVRLVATQNCYVLFGSAPVADTSQIYLPANVVSFFAFSSGEKVSVVRDSADGNLFITPAA